MIQILKQIRLETPSRQRRERHLSPWMRFPLVEIRPPPRAYKFLIGHLFQSSSPYEVSGGGDRCKLPQQPYSVSSSASLEEALPTPISSSCPTHRRNHSNNNNNNNTNLPGTPSSNGPVSAEEGWVVPIFCSIIIIRRVLFGFVATAIILRGKIRHVAILSNRMTWTGIQCVERLLGI